MTDQQQFCLRCGAALTSGANFCEACGAPVAKAAAAQPTEPPQPAKPADPLPDPLPSILEPPPVAALPPRPAQTPPPASSAQTPPPATYPQLRSYTPPPAAKTNSKLPWILGAIGCLGILCLALIGGGLIFFLNSDSAADAIATAMPVSPTQPLVVAPTQPLVIAPTQPALPTQAPLATQAVFSTQAAQPTFAAGPVTWPAAIGQQMTSSYFSDDFSSKTYDWADVSDNLRSWLYEDAHYAMHLFEPDYTIWAYLPLDFTPTTIGFDAAVVEGYDQGAYGVICYYQDESNYYFVSVDPVFVEYSIGYVQDDEYYSLLDEMWLDAAHLNPSPYAVNSIMVTCDQDMITLFINNEFEGQADLGGLVDSGDTAIYGETWEDTPKTGYKVLFDNFYAFKPQQ